MPEQKRPKTPVAAANDNDSGESDDSEEQAKIGARLKEAREYVGLLQEDVASALGIPRASVSAMESGKRRVTGLEVRRLARIYRKPVGWLLGEDDIELSDAEPLFRATESLSDRDRDQVLRFADTERQLTAALAERRGTDPAHDHYAALLVAIGLAASRAALMAWCDLQGRRPLVDMLADNFDAVGTGLAEPTRSRW